MTKARPWEAVERAARAAAVTQAIRDAGSIKGAAEALGVPLRTLHRWVKQDSIPTPINPTNRKRSAGARLRWKP